MTPRRVVIARCLKKGGNTNMKFHRMERLQVISLAAGVMHSTALTADGALFYWNSSDPDLRCQQVRLLCVEVLSLNGNCVACVPLNCICTGIHNGGKECCEHLGWKVLDCTGYINW